MGAAEDGCIDRRHGKHLFGDMVNTFQRAKLMVAMGC
jgi:hypothetical protein